MDDKKVGVIGLGLMGTAFTERLLGAGYVPHVFNRTREKAGPLLAQGALWTDNPLAVCDRVIISLYTTQTVEEVLGRLDAGLHEGQILIDTTTGDPSETAALGARLAERGVAYLDAPAAILACEAGKHVYVEKPCSHNLRESRLLLDAARRNKVVVQHGTQHRSNKLIAGAVQMLREGVIGDVLAARAWNVQRRGNIGNDGTHEIDYARWGLGVDTLPSKIVGLGGKYSHDDDQEFPDTATCVCEYPGDGKVGSRRQLIFEMRLWSTNYPYNCDSGAEYLGTKGKMFVSKRGKLEILDGRNQKIEAQPKEPPKLLAHREDFFDAIRTGRRPNADIEEAHRSVAVVHLANVAVRLGRSLEFDPQKEQVVGDEEANKLLSRKYREEGHWAVPKGAPKVPGRLGANRPRGATTLGRSMANIPV